MRRCELSLSAEVRELFLAYHENPSVENRNKIVEKLVPYIEGHIHTYKPGQTSEYIGAITETLIKKTIPGWDPSRDSSLMAYLSTSIYNALKDAIKDEEQRLDVTSFEDVQEARSTVLGPRAVVEEQSESIPKLLIDSLYEDDNKQRAYEFALEWFYKDIPHGRETIKRLKKTLTSEFDLYIYQAEDIIDQARVSLRFILQGSIGDVDVAETLSELPDHSLFKRLTDYVDIPDRILAEIIKLFGGTQVKVPKGYDY